MSAWGQEPHDVFDQLSGIDGVLLQGERARFDFRKVENVANQRQQRLSGLPDSLHIGALFGFELCFQQQARHPEHAIHRRADFMAHGSEEAGLGTACRFSFVASLGERILQFFSLGDVAADALDFDQSASGIADRIVLPGNPAPTISRPKMLVVLDAHMASFQSREATEHRSPGIGMQLRRKRLAQGRFCQAEQLEEGFVGVGQPVVRRPPDYGIALRIDQPLVTGFALVQARIHGRKVLERLLELLRQ
jgi:hypothetical protein